MLAGAKVTVAVPPGSGARGGPALWRVDAGGGAGVVRVTATEDLDAASEESALGGLRRLLDDTDGHRWLVLSIGRDHFVDARGLWVLLDTARRASSRGRELVLVDLPPSLRRMVEVLGLESELVAVPRFGPDAVLLAATAPRMPDAPEPGQQA